MRASGGFSKSHLMLSLKVMNTAKILRYGIYLGVAALLFTPFIVANSMYFPFITGKAFYFRIIVELMFGAWVVLALIDKTARPKLTWLSGAMLAFVAIPLLGVIFGVNTTDAIWSNFERMIGWITILHFGMLFAAASHTIKPKHWHWFFYLSLGVSVVIGIMGLKEVPNESRIDASLGNPIYLGMYSLFHAFLAGYYLIGRIKRAVKNSLSLLADWQVYVFSLLGVFNLIVLYFTQTRGAILGLLAGLFVSSLVVALFQRSRPLVRKLGIAGVILPLIAVGLFFGFRDTEFVQEQPVIGRFAQIDLQEGNAGSRIDTWQIGLEGYTERPLAGWGMGNYNYVFDRYYKSSMHDDAEWFDRAHNVVVEWLVAAGPLGVLSYLSLFAAAIFLLWRKPEGGEEFSVSERAVLVGLLVSYLVQNLFVFDHLVSYLMFALVLAWLHARSRPDYEFTYISFEPSKPAQAWTGTAVAVLTLVLAFNWNYAAINQAQAVIDGLQERSQAQRLQRRGQAGSGQQVQQLYDRGLNSFKEAIDYGAMGTQEARERLNRAAMAVARTNGTSSEVARDYYEAAHTNMRAQIAEEPNDLRHHVFLGDLYMAYDQPERAIEQFKIAKEISGGQKQSILFALGEAYEANGQTEKGLAQYEQAYELPTEFDDVAIEYAAALIRAEKIDQSDAVLEEHFGTTTLDNRTLIRAYQQAGYTERAIPILEKRVEDTKGQVGNLRSVAQTYVSLAAGYYQADEPDEAIATLEDLKDRFPQVASQIDPMIDRIESGEPVQMRPGGN
jgi:O-antigen ligase/lipopolysaccharide biosynthesis regulator YciM